MPQTLYVVARLVARPGTITAVQAILLDLIAPTRQEPGCLRYELLHNSGDATDFTFIEEWADEAALAAHGATPHLLGALAKVEPLLAVAPDVRRYHLIG